MHKIICLLFYANKFKLVLQTILINLKLFLNNLEESINLFNTGYILRNLFRFILKQILVLLWFIVSKKFWLSFTFFGSFSCLLPKFTTFLFFIRIISSYHLIIVMASVRSAMLLVCSSRFGSWISMFSINKSNDSVLAISFIFFFDALFGNIQT